jgi:hypothetical protein
MYVWWIARAALTKMMTMQQRMYGAGGSDRELEVPESAIQRAKRTRCQAIGDVTRVTQGGNDAGDGGALYQRPDAAVGRVLTGRILTWGKSLKQQLRSISLERDVHETLTTTKHAYVNSRS